MRKQLSEMENKLEISHIHLRFLDYENREGRDISGKYIIEEPRTGKGMIAQMAANIAVSSA